MAKAQILRINEKSDLKKVPKRYAGLVGPSLIGQTLIILDGRAHKVATTKEIEKLIKRIELKTEERYTVLTVNLSQEAAKLLDDFGIDFIAERNDFVWTDERFNQREKRRDELLNRLREENSKKKSE